MKEENWGRLKIVQDVSCLNRTLCWLSIFFSFIVSSEKEGLASGSSSQHSFIILYLSQHKNYAWHVEQQFFRSIPSETKCEAIRCCFSWPVEQSTSQYPFVWLFKDFQIWPSVIFFLEKRIMVNTAIFMLIFIYLLFHSLFICLKGKIFTYCLECGVKRLEQGWIGAIQILMIII